MKRFLRFINSMPFPYTVRHYYALGAKDKTLEGKDLDTPEAWDEARKSHPHFFMPDTREAWLGSLEQKKDGQDGGLKQRARNIANLLMTRGINSVRSVGVGNAALEYFILNEYPTLKMHVSEYNDESVERLRKVFPEGLPHKFDIMYSEWLTDDDSNHLVLMYRVDPHFTDKEWREIFKSMHWAGVQNVLFIPANMLSMIYLFNERRVGWKYRLKGGKLSFAGWLRTKASFEQFWKGLYIKEDIVVGGLKAFLLKRI